MDFLGLFLYFMQRLQHNFVNHDLSSRGGIRRSTADIVVATPGRLVDHINKNSGLCLEHLRFLVSELNSKAALQPVTYVLCVNGFNSHPFQIIDEADRMIDRMHQSWLSQVVKAVYRSGGVTEAVSMFRRTEPAHVTAARWVRVSTSTSVVKNSDLLSISFHFIAFHFIC